MVESGGGTCNPCFPPSTCMSPAIAYLEQLWGYDKRHSTGIVQRGVVKPKHSLWQGEGERPGSADGGTEGEAEGKGGGKASPAVVGLHSAWQRLGGPSCLVTCLPIPAPAGTFCPPDLPTL